MFEFANRIAELASSNLNTLVASATDPAKMLRLLMAELEESVIALGRKAKELERGAQGFVLEAERFEAAAATWEDKAKLAMAHDREDLARGALAERNAAREAGGAQRDAASAARDEAAAMNRTVAGLEAKHGETRTRLLKLVAENAPVRGKVARARGKTDALLDRFADLEKRIGYAEAAKGPDLDRELAALADKAALEADLAALRKSAKKKAK